MPRTPWWRLPDSCPASAQPGDAFLDHRGHERSVTGKESAAREGAALRRHRRLLHVKQPMVHPKKPVEPHAMVEARLLDAGIEPREAKRIAGDVEQGHVAGIGKRRLVEQGIVRQATHRPYPRMRHGRDLRRIDDGDWIHLTD